MSVAAISKSCLEESQQFEDVEDEPLTCTQKVERPLAGIIAYVDVRSGRKSSINTSQSISHSLTDLGASIAPRLTKDVTHMVFKDGKTSRERMDNYNGFLVNPLWVDACKRCNERVSEAKYPVTGQDNRDSPVVLGRMKRIKSMQPKPLSEEAIIRSVERNRKRRQEGGIESCSKKSPPTRFVLASDDEEATRDPNEAHYQSTDSSDLFELPPLTIPKTPGTDLQKEKPQHTKSQQNDYTPSVLSRSTSPDGKATPLLDTSTTKPLANQKTGKCAKPTKKAITSPSIPQVSLKLERATPSKRKKVEQMSNEGQPVATTRKKTMSLKKPVVTEGKENKRPKAKPKLAASVSDDQVEAKLVEQPKTNSVSGEKAKLSLVKTEGTSNKRSRKRVSFDGQKPTLVLTSVQQQDLEIVYAIAKKLGQFEISRYVDDKTTHVVSGAPRRTINILSATAKGCWILSLEWIWKSLEAGHWLNEEAFEMVTEFPAAQFFRLERQQGGVLYRPTLFHPAGSIFVSSDTNPPPQQLERLLGYAGAKVTASKRKADVCVGRSEQDSATTATIVSESWVLDSISEHALLPQEDFVVDENEFSQSSSTEL